MSSPTLLVVQGATLSSRALTANVQSDANVGSTSQFMRCIQVGALTSIVPTIAGLVIFPRTGLLGRSCTTFVPHTSHDFTTLHVPLYRRIHCFRLLTHLVTLLGRRFLSPCMSSDKLSRLRRIQHSLIPGYTGWTKCKRIATEFFFPTTISLCSIDRKRLTPEYWRHQEEAHVATKYDLIRHEIPP